MSESADYTAAHAVVLSSRVRLARNLRGLPFPDRAPGAVRAEVCQRVMAAARERLPVQEALAGSPTLRRQLLFEGHLISRHLLAERPESAICMDAQRRCTVMINEEDHLRIQVLQPGLALEKAWQVANELDDFLEQKLDYAFSSVLGYLTTCPTNVGTGMRASAMMHLPALVLLNEMEPIANGLSKIGLTVRGRWGEGTAAIGHMFQVSNQRTLGLTEERIVADLGEIVRELEGHELHARARLKREKRLYVEDVAARAKGIVTSARLMTAQEALERLSELRLGILLGLVRGLDVQLVDELWLAVQPAHLQAAAGRAMSSAERDQARARLLRSMLRGRAPKRAQKEKPHE